MKVSQAQKMGGADVQILILSIQDYSLDLKKCHPLQRYTQIQRQEHRHKHIHSLLIKFSVSPYFTVAVQLGAKGTANTAKLFSNHFYLRSKCFFKGGLFTLRGHLEQ